jgi:hypothetical protein
VWRSHRGTTSIAARPGASTRFPRCACATSRRNLRRSEQARIRRAALRFAFPRRLQKPTPILGQVAPRGRRRVAAAPVRPVSVWAAERSASRARTAETVPVAAAAQAQELLASGLTSTLVPAVDRSSLARDGVATINNNVSGATYVPSPTTLRACSAGNGGFNRPFAQINNRSRLSTSRRILHGEPRLTAENPVSHKRVFLRPPSSALADSRPAANLHCGKAAARRQGPSSTPRRSGGISFAPFISHKSAFGRGTNPS